MCSIHVSDGFPCADELTLDDFSADLKTGFIYVAGNDSEGRSIVVSTDKESHSRSHSMSCECNLQPVSATLQLPSCDCVSSVLLKSSAPLTRDQTSIVCHYVWFMVYWMH